MGGALRSGGVAVIYAVALVAAAIGVMLQILALITSLVSCSCRRYAVDARCPRHGWES